MRTESNATDNRFGFFAQSSVLTPHRSHVDALYLCVDLDEGEMKFGEM